MVYSWCYTFLTCLGLFYNKENIFFYWWNDFNFDSKVYLRHAEVQMFGLVFDILTAMNDQGTTLFRGY